MRIALCLYGLVGSISGKNGAGEQLDPKLAFEYYKKHIIDVNDEVDVLHSCRRKSSMVNPEEIIATPAAFYTRSKRIVYSKMGIGEKENSDGWDRLRIWILFRLSLNYVHLIKV